MPIIEELLDEFHGTKFFSKVDIKAGYPEVRMNEANIQKTVFNTHHGNYELLVMPLG